MPRRFEPVGGTITSIAIDPDGFVSVRATHPACGASTRYASGPSDVMSEDVECSGCGEMLMRYTGQDGEAVEDASYL